MSIASASWQAGAAGAHPAEAALSNGPDDLQAGKVERPGANIDALPRLLLGRLLNLREPAVHPAEQRVILSSERATAAAMVARAWAGSL